MHPDIETFNEAQWAGDRAICALMASLIDRALPEAESKIWHRHPVWFLDGNPIVGYSRQKAGVRLMFWSGAGFGEPGLTPGTGKFMDASAFFTSADEVREDDVARWLAKSMEIQWDYKNIRTTKGKLHRLT